MARTLNKFMDKKGLERGGDLHRVSTVAIRHHDHLLMGKRRDNGKWTTPGGHAEGDEDHHSAALREVQEETGLELDPTSVRELADPEEVTDDKGKKLHVQPFEAHLDERPKTSMKQDPDGEVHRWEWVDVSKGLPDHIEKNLHVPMDRNVLLPHVVGEGEKMSERGDFKGEKGGSLRKFLLKNKYDAEKIMAPTHEDEEAIEGPAEREFEEEIAQRGHRRRGGI